MSGTGPRESIFPTRMALTNTKTRLKGAQTGHSLLAKKRDALTTRFRAILRKVDEVSPVTRYPLYHLVKEKLMKWILLYVRGKIRRSGRWDGSCSSRRSPSQRSRTPLATSHILCINRPNRLLSKSEQSKKMSLASCYPRSKSIASPEPVRSERRSSHPRPSYVILLTDSEQ